MPVPGPSQPSSKPNLRRIAHSMRAARAGPCSTRAKAISASSRGKSSGRPASAAPTRPPAENPVRPRALARAGGVRGVRKPHSRTSHPHGSRRLWERPVWQSTMGRSYSSTILAPATILSTTLGGTAQPAPRTTFRSWEPPPAMRRAPRPQLPRIRPGVLTGPAPTGLRGGCSPLTLRSRRHSAARRVIPGGRRCD